MTTFAMFFYIVFNPWFVVFCLLHGWQYQEVQLGEWPLEHRDAGDDSFWRHQITRGPPKAQSSLLIQMLKDIERHKTNQSIKPWIAVGTVYLNQLFTPMPIHTSLCKV